MLEFPFQITSASEDQRCGRQYYYDGYAYECRPEKFENDRKYRHRNKGGKDIEISHAKCFIIEDLQVPGPVLSFYVVFLFTKLTVFLKTYVFYI